MTELLHQLTMFDLVTLVSKTWSSVGASWKTSEILKTHLRAATRTSNGQRWTGGSGQTLPASRRISSHMVNILTDF